MTTCVPILDADGWLTDPVVKLQTAVAHAYACEHSMSDQWSEKVFSVAFVIAKNEGNVQATIMELENGFAEYLRELFPESVTVEISERFQDEDSPSAYIDIFIEVTEGGKTISLAKTLEFGSGVLINMMDIINSGGSL